MKPLLEASITGLLLRNLGPCHTGRHCYPERQRKDCFQRHTAI